MSELSDTKVTRTIAVKRDLVGLPGQPFRFVIRRVTSDESSRVDEGETKEFDVVFTLSRPGEALSTDDRVSNSEMLGGNSYLRLRRSDEPATSEAPQIKFNVLTDDGLFEIQELVNAEGFLGKIEILSVKAKDFMQAEGIARRLIIPSLSWHSTHFDIPLNIYQVDIVEIATGNFMIYGAAKPFDALVVSNGIRVYDIKEESGAYASIYREALNGNSHVYQFLCFYKIVEGIRKRRERLSAEAAAKGESPVRLSERVPKDTNELIELLKKIFSADFTWDATEAESIFPKQVWGRKIADIVDKELRPLRNEIGHAFLDSSEIPLSLDEFANRARVVQYLPMTKCFARWMLRSEFPQQFPSSN